MMNQIDGVTFDEAANTAVRGRYGGVEIPFIGREKLVKNKLSTSRLKDKADAQELASLDVDTD